MTREEALEKILEVVEPFEAPEFLSWRPPEKRFSHDLQDLNLVFRRIIVPEVVAPLRREFPSPKFKIKVLYTYRSPDFQNELYHSGRGVTNAGAFCSGHCYGLAVDVVPFVQKPAELVEGSDFTYSFVHSYDELPEFFDRLGALAESAGLVWGGRWRTIKDYYHVEHRYFRLIGSSALAAYFYGVTNI